MQSVSNAIQKLHTVFSQLGIPETTVNYNSSCFVSDEFQSFLQANGISLITSSPYHPALNGLAECAVQIMKYGLNKVHNGFLNSRLARTFSVTSWHHTAQLVKLQQNCCWAKDPILGYILLDLILLSG